MESKSLFEIVCGVFKEINEGKKIPTSLKFRLNNINSRFLSYDEFIQYFNLKNEYEALKFILDDQNIEEIMRYSSRMNVLNGKFSIRTIRSSGNYLKDSSKEHLLIEKMLLREEKEYHK